MGKTDRDTGKKHLETTKLRMVKQSKILLLLLGEDCNPKDQNHTNLLYNLPEMEFRVEMLRIFKELKETMECTAKKKKKHKKQNTGGYESNNEKNTNRNVSTEKLGKQNEKFIERSS